MSDGSLALTSNEPMQERSIVVNASLLGDRVHFEASFDLFIAGDKNVGEGVSVCVGDLPEAPFGELGIGEGLIVRLLTASEKLEVLYDGEPVLERSLPLSLVRVAEGVRVRVAYEPSGLDVQLGDEVVVAGALLSTWSPRSEWRFGIGARTGVDRRDEHRVDNIRLRSGASYEPRSVAVEVASNGQQFTSTAVPFTFNVVPTVSSFYPERGPTSGSTEVVISGSNLGLASHYKCRFGALEVAASYDAEGGTIHCASAAQPAGSLAAARGVAERAAVHDVGGAVHVLRAAACQPGDAGRRPDGGEHAGAAVRRRARRWRRLPLPVRRVGRRRHLPQLDGRVHAPRHWLQ